MAEKIYKNDSIKSIDARTFTRLRAGVYCGSTEYSTQLLRELFSNALDEHNIGHGNNIIVKIDTKKNEYKVRDYAQGFPLNVIREDGKTVLQASFDTLNTSGKFTEDGVYEGTALGLNGIGSKLTNFLSHWLRVITWRDGQFEDLMFKEGVLDNRKVGKLKHESGTEVSWCPSEEFFTNPGVDLGKIRELFHVLTCLCVGLTIKLTIDGNEEVFFSSHGLNDLVDDVVKDSELIANRMNMNFADGKNKMDMVITYTSNYSLNMISYVNTGETDAGPHITQIKTILTREFNKFFKEKKWLKEKDTNFSGDDIQEGLLIAFNITTPGVSYDAQTKTRVVKLDMTPFTNAIVENLKYWFANNEKDIKVIFDKAAGARKAREAAKKAREAARNSGKKKTGLKAKMELSDKFIDCISKNPEERNLLLVEGLSAGGSTLEARNVNTDSIYMLRGKVLSVLKTTVDKVLSNQEYSDIIKVIGAGFGNDKFDVNKMNFNKIVITSDQDSDGFAIELLLITFFYTYMRPLVEAGKLYRAVTPLYIVTTKKQKYYCYSEEELTNWKETHTETYELAHCKG